MQPIHSKSILLQALQEGAVVLTPNNRLSLALLKDYFNISQNSVVAKPLCLPYKQYLLQLYHGHYLQDKPLLISEFHCQFLWQKQLNHQKALVYSTGLLTKVMDAWQTCLQWQIQPDDPIFRSTEQTQWFQQQWQEMEGQLQARHWISESHLVAYLSKQQLLPEKQAVYWVCFDEWTPEQKALQLALAERNCPQFSYDLQQEFANPKQEVFCAQDQEEELEQMLLWLEERLNAKDQKIGVIVPNLQASYAPLARRLEKRLPAHSYTLSLGHPLSDYPLVSHALQWLHLNPETISTQEARLLLLSPFLKGSQDEWMARSQLLQDSQILTRTVFPLKMWKEELARYTPILEELLHQLPALPAKASIAEWTEAFQSRLEHLGYPGEYGLDSINYQCYQHILSMLQKFRTLGSLNQSLSQQEALCALQNLADQTIFQPQSPDTPILLSGILEASGCEFDSLWWMNLTDECLPQQCKLNPFIPKALQLETLMPHSSPQKEFDLAQKLISRYQQASPRIVFSYPHLTGDKPNLPSPLIKHLPNYAPLTSHLKTQVQPPLVRVEETYLYPLDASETPKGGTHLLANQAKCPFKAFAAHRLQATKAEAPFPGLNPLQRGRLVHKILEIFWKDLHTQEQLLALDAHLLEAKIEQAIHQALDQLPDLKPHSDRLKNLELRRLTPIITLCLNWEKERQSFTVHALEKSYDQSLGSLNLNVRIDRMDQLANEQKCVIDYKTSMPTNPWKEDRPTEPQMLLYALLDETIRELVLVEIKAQKIQTLVFNESKLEEGQTWDEVKSEWRSKLEALANEFTQGHCPPTPINTSVCQYCEFASLCRFHLSD